jgi:opacity protein-like surface antigen
MDSPRPDKSVIWLFGLLLALLPGLLLASPQQIEVRDPYLELHTGPGRGYPIFYAVDRGTRIEIRHRFTDWYKIRTGDAVGWVHRDQLRATLESAGADGGTRAALLDRHIEGRLRAGMSAGIFDGDPIITFWGGYRIKPEWSAELGIAQVAGDYSSTRIYRLDAVHQPWPDMRFPPHLILGIGWFENIPRKTLVESNEEDAFGVAIGLGVSKQLEPRFALRADWRWQHAWFDDNQNFHELTAGFVLLF